MSEHVVINPRRRRRATHKRRRRNPVLATVNPRRRRRVHVYRRARRNPRMGQMLSLRGVGTKDILFGTAGMIATNTLAPKAAQMLGQAEAGVGGYVAKAAVALLGGYAVSKFVSKKGGQSFIFGGLIVLANDVWNNEVKPRIGLSGLSYYTPARSVFPNSFALPALPGGTVFTGQPTLRLPERLRAGF